METKEQKVERYVTEPMPKKEAFAKADDLRKKRYNYLDSYDVVKVED